MAFHAAALAVAPQQRSRPSEDSGNLGGQRLGDFVDVQTCPSRAPSVCSVPKRRRCLTALSSSMKWKGKRRHSTFHRRELGRHRPRHASAHSFLGGLVDVCLLGLTSGVNHDRPRPRCHDSHHQAAWSSSASTSSSIAVMIPLIGVGEHRRHLSRVALGLLDRLGGLRVFRLELTEPLEHPSDFVDVLTDGLDCRGEHVGVGAVRRYCELDRLGPERQDTNRRVMGSATTTILSRSIRWNGRLPGTLDRPRRSSSPASPPGLPSTR